MSHIQNDPVIRRAILTRLQPEFMEPIPSSASNFAQPKRALTSRELRKIAEAADGQRDEVLNIVQMTTSGVDTGQDTPNGENTKYRVAKVSDGPITDDPLPVWKKVFETNTPTKLRVRMGVRINPTKIIVPTTPAKEIDLPCEKYDAIFWSEASIEKFFFPYYVRHLEPEDFIDLMKAYYHPQANETIYAFVHYPPTDFSRVKLSGVGVPESVLLLMENGLRLLSEFVAVLRSRR